MLDNIQACIAFAESQGYRALMHIQADSEPQALLILNQIFSKISQALFTDSSTVNEKSLQNHSALAGLDFVLSKNSASEFSSPENQNINAHFCSAPLLHINQARPYLGQTLKLLAYNTFQGLNPNILAMLSGAVQQGGMMILITPTLAEWPQFDDPDYQKLQADQSSLLDGKDEGKGKAKEKPAKLFLSRGQQLLQQFILENTNYIISVDSAGVCYQGDKTIQPLLAKHSMQGADKFNNGEQKTAEQAVIIKSLLQQFLAIKNITEDDKAESLAASVIEGDRGRGKSACVGLYLKEILSTELSKNQSAENLPHIVITAIHRNALDSVLLHLSEFSQYVEFKALDEVVKDPNIYDILVVDEAAAVSSKVLKQCLAKAKQSIFSTTTAGYEGNGRGFSLRFKKVLEAFFPFENLNYFTLNQPIRYQADDPLETLINRWCLLNNDRRSQHHELITTAELNNIEYHYLSSVELAANEKLLTAVFALLLEAHYQTSADDARFILDYPNLIILVACIGDLATADVIGASLCVFEGNFDLATINSFATTPRRLRGHILPQQLANTCSEDWLALPFIRIVRIAVLDTLRNQGIASKLLSLLAEKQADAFLGASFGETTELLSFWQANSFQLMQLGVKAESSTGSVAAVVLKKPLNFTAADNVIDTLWQAQLAFCFKDCMNKAENYANNYFQEQSSLNSSVLNTLLASELYQLKRFCAGQMSLQQVYTALQSLLRSLKKTAYSQDVNGLNLTVVKPISIEAYSFDWYILSEVLFQVFAESHSIDQMSQQVNRAQLQLKLSGKKSWQHLCREYCKIALGIFNKV